MKKWIVFATCLFVSTSFAMPVPTTNITRLSLADKHFSYADYQQCKKGALHDCPDLLALAKALQIDSSLLKLSRVSDIIMLVRKTYLADGQQQYYILLADGRLINTIIDPRKIDPTLNGMYLGDTFIIINDDKPKILVTKNTTKIVVPLRITRNCLACDLVATASLEFLFDATKLNTMDVRVLDFIPAANSV